MKLNPCYECGDNDLVHTQLWNRTYEISCFNPRCVSACAAANRKLAERGWNAANPKKRRQR